MYPTRQLNSFQGRALGNLVELLVGEQVVVRLLRLPLQLCHKPGGHAPPHFCGAWLSNSHAATRLTPELPYRLLCAALLIPVPEG